MVGNHGKRGTAVSVGGAHRYAVFGLVLGSEFAFPELEGTEVDPAARADVEISIGRLPAAAYDIDYAGIALHKDASGLFIRVPGIAQFHLAQNGARLTVQPDAGAADEIVRTFLFGTIIGALLYQRDILPLHANAIEVEGAVFAIAGPSGAGKSTLAYQLQALGHRLLTDDICPLTMDAEGRFWAWRGMPRVKLWRDALEAFGQSTDGLTPLAVEPDKYATPLRRKSAAGPLPILGIYALDAFSDRGRAGFRELGGLDAVNVITAHSYRRRLAEVAGLGDRYLNLALRAAETIPVYEIERVRGLENLAAEASALVEHMKSLVRSARPDSPAAT